MDPRQSSLMGREGGRELPGGSSLCPGMLSALSIPRPSRQAHVMGSCWVTDRWHVPMGEPHPGHWVLWSLSPLVTRSPCLVLEDPMVTGTQARPDLSQPPHATARSVLLVGYSTPGCRKHAENPQRMLQHCTPVGAERASGGDPKATLPLGWAKPSAAIPAMGGGPRLPPSSSILLLAGARPSPGTTGRKGTRGEPPLRPGALCAPAPRSIALSPLAHGAGDRR